MKEPSFRGWTSPSSLAPLPLGCSISVTRSAESLHRCSRYLPWVPWSTHWLHTTGEPTPSEEGAPALTTTDSGQRCFASSSWLPSLSTSSSELEHDARRSETGVSYTLPLPFVASLHLPAVCIVYCLIISTIITKPYHPFIFLYMRTSPLSLSL